MIKAQRNESSEWGSNMKYYEAFIQTVKLRRIVVLLIVIGIIFALRSMLTLLFLTFIFTFLAHKTVKKIRKVIPISATFLVVAIYGLIVFGLYLVVTKYVPILIEQSLTMIDSLIQFYQQNPKNSDSFFRVAREAIDQFNLLEYLQNRLAVVLDYIQSFGKVTIAAVMAYILSFFFLIEEKRTFEFSRQFLHAEGEWFFQDLHYFFVKFTNTFGVVIEAQLFIALINTILTCIALVAMHFTQIPSLAVMIFLLSLVPVAGVILSTIPLSFIAYSIGGLNDVIIILLVILGIHLLESYLLNPKLMSSKTEIPIFFTFVILLFSEHYFGLWGLIMGIPVFSFIFDLLKINNPAGRIGPKLIKFQKRK